MPIFDRDHADSPEKAYVYILRCVDGTLYCGWTNDLAARLDAHNSGKGAKYTRGRGPVELAYSEMFGTQSEAMHREAEIKKLSRPQKQALLDCQTGGEMLTVYDAADRPCGARPRSIVHAQGLRHHVCHLWVVGVRDGVRGIWLQKRQNDRPLYPGFYDLTATGHMDPGETPLTAAHARRSDCTRTRPMSRPAAATASAITARTAALTMSFRLSFSCAGTACPRSRPAPRSPRWCSCRSRTLPSRISTLTTSLRAAWTAFPSRCRTKSSPACTARNGTACARSSSACSMITIRNIRKYYYI